MFSTQTQSLNQFAIFHFQFPTTQKLSINVFDAMNSLLNFNVWGNDQNLVSLPFPVKAPPQRFTFIKCNNDASRYSLNVSEQKTHSFMALNVQISAT